MFTPLALILISARLIFAACPALPSPLPAPTALPEINVIPDPWTFFNGSRVTTAEDWQCRRKELLTLAQEYFYGYYPDHANETVTATRSGNTLSVTVAAGGKTGTFSASLALPAGASKASPVPVAIAALFVDNAVFINNGIAVVTFNTAGVAADSDSKTGAFWNLYNGRDIGIYTAWAWGYHRILDGLILAVPEIDSSRVAVTGCSRWGKGALAAGIFDDRITLTLPQSAGFQGIGPWRFFFDGSQNEQISNPWLRHWATSKLVDFVPNVKKFPIESASLVSIIAPRAIVWDVGQTDLQSNPRGEATVTFAGARPVYDWLGYPDRIGNGLRSGGHCDNSGYANVKDFVVKTFFNRTITRDYTSTSPYPAYPQAYPWISSVPPKPTPTGGA